MLDYSKSELFYSIGLTSLAVILFLLGVWKVFELLF